MIPQQHTRVIKAYAEVARPLISERFGSASCIAAARVTIDVMRHFGLRAEPVSVVARASNAQYWACRARVGGRPPESQKEFERWHVQDGAYVAQVGNATAPDGSGHVVAVVEAHTLIDGAIDQLDRPRYNLRLPPILIAQCQPDFRQGATVMLGVYGGATVQYDAVEENDWFRRSEYWWSEDVAAVAADVVNRVDTTR